MSRAGRSHRRFSTPPPDRSGKAVLKIRIDGAARGNPGPAGIGVVIADGAGRQLKEISTYLGEATNNVAETLALIIALQEASRLRCRQVTVLTDSELIARQVTGAYRVKDRELRWLQVLVQNLIQGFGDCKIQHIPRGENRQADRLANRAVTEGLRRHPGQRRKPKVTAPTQHPLQATLFAEHG